MSVTSSQNLLPCTCNINLFLLIVILHYNVNYISYTVEFLFSECHGSSKKEKNMYVIEVMLYGNSIRYRFEGRKCTHHS